MPLIRHNRVYELWPRTADLRSEIAILLAVDRSKILPCNAKLFMCLSVCDDFRSFAAVFSLQSSLCKHQTQQTDFAAYTIQIITPAKQKRAARAAAELR